MAGLQDELALKEHDAVLFTAVGIVLPAQSPPLPAERIAEYFERRRNRGPVLLALELGDLHFTEGEQPCLPIIAGPNRYEARCPSWLNYGVFDTFRDIESARSAALALEARGVNRIGELLRLSEGRLARSRHMNPTALAAIVERLGRAGFQLGRPIDVAPTHQPRPQLHLAVGPL